MNTPDNAYLKSVFYEQLVEHVFIAEVLQEAWYTFGMTAEVLRSEIDAFGYDLVFECNGKVRHVQLKASKHDAKASGQKVNVALARNPAVASFGYFATKRMARTGCSLPSGFSVERPGGRCLHWTVSRWQDTRRETRTGKSWKERRFVSCPRESSRRLKTSGYLSRFSLG